MAAIAFTDRELRRAWQANFNASIHSNRSNAHRLLLFYAVECGLKAVLMKRQGVNCTTHCQEIIEAQHNINKLLDALSAGQVLKLPNRLNMTPIKDGGQRQERILDSGKINQMWRYGGQLNINYKSNDSNILTDEKLERQLIQISEWIRGELVAP